MHIHLVQTNIKSLDAAANRARVLELLQGVTVSPGSMIVLPELFSTGTLPQDFDRALAAKIAEDDRAFLARLAQDTQSTVVAGALGLGTDEAGLLQNLCITVGPDGLEKSSYQKIHPFSLGGEDKIFAGGGSVVITAVEGFTMQTAVCYDLRFPELFRTGVRSGGDSLVDRALVDLIVVPANWPASRREHWDVLLRARAIENQCYVAGVNCIGTQHGTSHEGARTLYAGGTALVSPKGEVLAALHAEDEAEGVVSAEISADHVRAWRRVFPALRDRKPDGFWSG